MLCAIALCSKRPVMKALTLLLLSFSFLANAQTNVSSVRVNIPSVEQEASHIWRTINDIFFFEKNNYRVNLPPGTIIEKLKQKARTGGLISTDYETILTFLQDSIYQPEDYARGYEKIAQQTEKLVRMIAKIPSPRSGWNFKKFAVYEITLTLYGPGGSYDPEAGSVLVFTTPEGKFKQYDDPVNTLMHEIIHIGLEEAIISSYNVPHALKERIVDLFVFLHFKKQLPAYKVQDMGDYRMDKYLKRKKDFNDLEKYVRQVMNEQ